MNAKTKQAPTITAGLVKPMAAAWAHLSTTPEFQAVAALSSEQQLQAWEGLQGWVLDNREELPPLSRIGAAAGLTRAQATSLLTGIGNRTAKTPERLAILQILLKRYSFTPAL